MPRDEFVVGDEEEAIQSEVFGEQTLDRIACQKTIRKLLYEFNDFDHKANIEIASGVLIESVARAIEADDFDPGKMNSLCKSLLKLLINMAANHDGVDGNEYIALMMAGGDIGDLLREVLDEEDIDELLS